MSAFVSQCTCRPSNHPTIVSEGGHLTCTNKRAHADEHKLARNEGLLVLPAMHLLCLCSMLVPSVFSHLRKRYAKKCDFSGNLTGWVAFRLEDVRETE